MPMSNTITLRCPKCKQTTQVERAEWDYPEATTLVVRCGECCGGDFDQPVYRDAKGKEVLYDVAEIPEHRARIAEEALAQ